LSRNALVIIALQDVEKIASCDSTLKQPVPWKEALVEVSVVKAQETRATNNFNTIKQHSKFGQQIPPRFNILNI